MTVSQAPLVAVLDDEPEIRRMLVDALEVRFLANRGPHLHFGLLTDFADAAQEHLPQDAAVAHFITSLL